MAVCSRAAELTAEAGTRALWSAAAARFQALFLRNMAAMETLLYDAFCLLFIELNDTTLS